MSEHTPEIHDKPNQRPIERMGALVASLVMVSIPFLLVTFPPITDLPQQTAQIRLFIETWSDPVNSPYTIQWLTPYSLSYAALGLAWLLAGAAQAGKIAMLFIGIAWVLGIHILAARENRSSTAAVLASAFFFNHVMYWGFYSFAIGWPIFLLWFYIVEKPAFGKLSAVNALITFCTAALLYASHVLWLMCGLAWMALAVLVLRRSFKEVLARGAFAAPLIALVALWYPIFAGSTMATPPLWGTNPFSRLIPTWQVDAALGGIYGPAEYALFALAFLWIAGGLAASRGRLTTEAHVGMLLAAAFFLSLALLLPDKYMNTIRFAQRWAPAAMIMALLGAPRPPLSPALRKIIVYMGAGAFCLSVTLAWQSFQTHELSGLKQSLAAMPARPKLLGLSFIENSEFVKGRPFIQVFAYGQVLHGGRLNFSFAEFSPCLVVFKDKTPPRWTSGLEWFPQRATEADLAYFGFVLVNGLAPLHEELGRRSGLKALTDQGRWRLYKVEGNPRRKPNRSQE